MSRFPPPSYYNGREPLPWDDNDHSYNYLDPTDRDEYDDFAYEQPPPKPRFPQTKVTLSPAGSIRTSYHNRSARSSYTTVEQPRQLTPPRGLYTPEQAYYDPYDQHRTSPTRSYQDYQREASPMRSESPTRVPLTGVATGTAGYEMAERKGAGDGFDHFPKSKMLTEEQRARKKRKWILIGLIVFLVVCGTTGAVVYLVKFRNSGSSSSLSSGSANGRNGYGATASDLKPDPSLKKIFDGMDYTPLNAQYPACGAIQSNITADVAILSQLTTKVRLYGTDCEQATMVLDAIQDLKVDLTVFIGVWVDTNATTLARQLSDMYSILNKYPVDLIDGVAVGNEVLFRQDKTEAELIALINDVRTNITAMNLGKKIPVCTSDLGSNWSPSLAAAVDCVMANIHPFFSGIDVNDASQWTLNFLNDDVVPQTTSLTTKPEIIISEGSPSLFPQLTEVGWPSGEGSVNSSVAGISEMQYFITHFLPAAKNASVTYYWFEGYDEPWKVMYDTATEKYEDKWVVSQRVNADVGIIGCKWVFEGWDYVA